MVALGDQNVYMFEISARHALSNRPDYIIADHGDDILFIMGYSLFQEFEGKSLNISHNEAAEKAQEMIIQYWANFAKTG